MESRLKKGAKEFRGCQIFNSLSWQFLANRRDLVTSQPSSSSTWPCKYLECEDGELVKEGKSALTDSLVRWIEQCRSALYGQSMPRG
jgi:hypothetical protein